MYTPRAIFSRLFLQICSFVLSLYTLDRLVTLSCKISDQSPITCVNSHYKVRGQSMAITWVQKCGWKIWPFEVFQNGRRLPSWIWSNRKWRHLIRCPRKPHPRTKHKGNRVMNCWVMAIWSFSHLGRIGHRILDIGDQTRRWFYILSDAAMQCIGQTIVIASQKSHITSSLL